MALNLPAPDTLTAFPSNHSAMITWIKVKDAAGYILELYKSSDPEACIDRYYTQQTHKNVTGLINGEEYMVSVSSFHYEENDEVIDSTTDKISFVPKAVSLTTRETICLAEGESTQIEWDSPNPDAQVSFHPEDTSIVAVLPDGTVTAYSQGSTRVNLVSDDGQKTSANIIVDRDIPSTTVKKTTLIFAGDISTSIGMQNAKAGNGYDFYDMFSPELRNILAKADYSACVLDTMCDDSNTYTYETPFFTTGQEYHNSPSTVIKAISDAGFRGACTASKHNFDCGMDAVTKLRRQVLRSGMNHIGTLGDNPVIRKIGDIRIAIISLSQLQNLDESGLENRYEDLGRYSENLLETYIATAREKKADFIIVMMSWGVINSSVVSPQQRMTAQNIAEYGADLILGSGTRTLQAYEEIVTSDSRVVPCLYSLGSLFNSSKELYDNSLSALAQVIISEDSNSFSCSFSLIPTISANRNGVVTVLPVDPVATKIQAQARATIRSFYPPELFYDFAKENVILQGSQVLKDIASELKCINTYIEPDSDDYLRSVYDYFIFDLVAFRNKTIQELNEYLDLLAELYTRERLILVRISVPKFKLTSDAIISHLPDKDINGTMRSIEDHAIDRLHPLVIDIAGQYLLSDIQNEDQIVYEKWFYKHAKKIINSIAQGNSQRIYFKEIDPDIWVERNIRYYDMLKKNDYRNSILGYTEAADMLIRNKELRFVKEFKKELIKLKKSHAELGYVRNILGNSPELYDLIVASDEFQRELDE